MCCHTCLSAMYTSCFHSLRLPSFTACTTPCQYVLTEAKQGHVLEVSNFAPYIGSLGKVDAHCALVHGSCMQGCYGCMYILYASYEVVTYITGAAQAQHKLLHRLSPLLLSAQLGLWLHSALRQTRSGQHGHRSTLAEAGLQCTLCLLQAQPVRSAPCNAWSNADNGGPCMR